MKEFDIIFCKKAILICLIGIIWNTLLMIINAIESVGNPFNFLVMHLILTTCLPLFKVWLYRLECKLKEENNHGLETTVNQ